MADSAERLNGAALQGNASQVSELIGKRANLEWKDEANGATALHNATWKGHTAVVEMLIKAGAKLEATNKHGTTAVGIAAYGGHADALEKLLAAGANPNVKNSKGDTPLERAKEAKQTRCVGLLQGHQLAQSSLTMQQVSPASSMFHKLGESFNLSTLFGSIGQRIARNSSTGRLSNKFEDALREDGWALKPVVASSNQKLWDTLAVF